MRTVEFDLVSTLLVSMVVFFLGRFLVVWVPVLRRFNIPAPVVGGGPVALLLAEVDGVLHVKLGFNLALKDMLLLMFFPTVGLAADARMVVRPRGTSVRRRRRRQERVPCPQRNRRASL
jgi:ESS family glutamate:Na+ symporter